MNHYSLTHNHHHNQYGLNLQNKIIEMIKILNSIVSYGRYNFHIIPIQSKAYHEALTTRLRRVMQFKLINDIYEVWYYLPTVY